jgi:hypothetical protein
MHSCQGIYRDLFEALDGATSGPAYAELLVPWVQTHREETNWLLAFCERSGDPIPAAPIEDLWRLYALSRVNETLLLDFQPLAASGPQRDREPRVSLDDYTNFMEALGLRDTSALNFHPFFHEIVEVEPSDHDEKPITLVQQHWPPLMLGPMMFSRGGVTVGGGRNYIRKAIAETSTLYWAYRRKNRPSQDLSVGWGSNSQWRTEFRRDYRVGTNFYFNVDGTNDLRRPLSEPDRDGLTRGERIELLIHRCFITVDKDKRHNDLWPYDDVLQVTEGATRQGAQAG